MAKDYISRETAALAAADTPVDVNVLGHEAAAAITVPSGRSRISRIFGAIASDGAATGATVIWVRITGNGVKGGEQTIMLGGVGGTLATSDIQTQNSLYAEVDIGVIAGNQVNVQAEANVDTGTASVGITFEFS